MLMNVVGKFVKVEFNPEERDRDQNRMKRIEIRRKVTGRNRKFVKLHRMEIGNLAEI